MYTTAQQRNGNGGKEATHHLGDDRDMTPQRIEVDGRYRDAIVVNLSTREDTPKQRKRERTLAATRPSDDTDALASLDLKVEVVQHLGAVLNYIAPRLVSVPSFDNNGERKDAYRRVARAEILDPELTTRRPVRRWHAALDRLRLLFNFHILLQTLERVSVHLEHVKHLYEEQDHLTKVNRHRC